MNKPTGRDQPPISDERLTELLHRIHARRHRAQMRAGLAAVVVALVLGIGFGLPHLLTGSDASGAQSLQMNPSLTPGSSPARGGRSTSPAGFPFGSRVPSGSGPLILETAFTGRAVIVRLGSSDPPYRLPADIRISQPVSNPAGGWATVSSRGRLALVTVDGHVQVFKPAPAHGQSITGLAVSPGGAQVAVSYRSFTGATRAGARLAVAPTPGHSGVQRSWTLDLPEIDSQIGSLSWAPDGRHLTYIATHTTGGGFTGTPLTMNTQGAGDTIMSSTHGGGCDADESAGWLGASKHFGAIFDPCHGRALRLIVSEIPGGPAIRSDDRIPDRGCQAGGLSVTNDGTQVLLTCDRNLYLINSSHVHTLPAAYPDLTEAAFAGGSG